MLHLRRHLYLPFATRCGAASIGQQRGLPLLAKPALTNDQVARSGGFGTHASVIWVYSFGGCLLTGIWLLGPRRGLRSAGFAYRATRSLRVASCSCGQPLVLVFQRACALRVCLCVMLTWP